MAPPPPLKCSIKYTQSPLPYVVFIFVHCHDFVSCDCYMLYIDFRHSLLVEESRLNKGDLRIKSTVSCIVCAVNSHLKLDI